MQINTQPLDKGATDDNAGQSLQSNVEKNWSAVKRQMRSKFEKLTDMDIESFKNNIDVLEGHLQKTYKYTAGVAKTEYQNFVKALDFSKDGGTSKIKLATPLAAAKSGAV